jgi:hypothetical protein
MKFIIKKILKEEIEKSKNPLSQMEILLFKFIHKKRKQFKKKKDFIDEIKNTLKYLSLDEDLGLFYYEMFTLNFRPEGDYENLTYDNFKGVKDFKARKTLNVNASEFTKAKMPFVGSNIEGYWGTDPKGKDYYVVTSYGWYPIYLFKEGIWYKVTNTYSSSTSRQMRHSNPVEFDEKIGVDIIYATKEEMRQLINGATYEQIMRKKTEDIIKNKESLLSKRKIHAKSNDWSQNNPRLKARFKVVDIRKEGDKAIVDVLIDDAGEIKDGKLYLSNGEYLKGENADLNKKKVENAILQKVIFDFKDYVGKFPMWSEGEYSLEVTPEKHNIRFNFIHSKEK